MTLALAAVGTGLWLGHRFVTTSDRFAIETIELRGAKRLAESDLLAAIPVRVGDNVFTADLDQVADRLRAHAWIASVETRRELPHRLVIDIREYEPVALVALGELYLVDASGHPFKRAELDAGDGAGLPIVTGIDRAAYRRDPQGTARTIVDALGVLASWQTGPRPAIGEIHVGAHGALALRTYDHGTAIELGTLHSPAELASRITTFDAAWAELAEDERVRARAIHLDARKGHVSVAFKD